MALVLLLTACSSSGPVKQVDPELYRIAKSARIAFSRGEYEQAARLYRRSLNRARAMDHAVEIGNNAYNLAACSIELGEYDRARELLDESRAAFQHTGDLPDGILILEVKIALAQGVTAEAEELLASVGEGGEDSILPEILVQYKLLRADLALRLNDPDKARRELKVLRDDMRELGAEALQAEADRLEGELLLMEGKFSAAGSAFDRRSELLRQVEQYRAMAITLGRAGEAYRDSGAYCQSLDRFFRSARSLFAQGDPTGSLIMIESALEVARNCEEESLRQRFRDLFEEIKEAVEDIPAGINE